MQNRKNVPSIEMLSAEDVSRAFREESAENERLYRESEARAALSNRMKLMREEKSVTQAELATRIGRKQPFIARLELGGYDRCEISTLRTIMRALGYDFNFDVMIKKIPKPIFSGASSCDQLEAALEDDATFERRVAEYSRNRWAAESNRNAIVPRGWRMKPNRGLGAAA